MGRATQYCALVVLLGSSLLFAQRPPSPQTSRPPAPAQETSYGNPLSIRFRFISSQPLQNAVTVELYASSGLLVRRATVSEKSRIVTFGIPWAGRYELRVTGEDIESLTHPFTILANEPEHTETVALTMAKRATAQSRIEWSEFADPRVPAKARRELEKGNAAAGREKWGEARARYQAAIEKYGGYAEAYFRLGVVSLHLEQNRQASDAFERALQLRPESTSAAIQLARVNALGKRYKVAEELLQKVVSEHPHNTEALFRLADAQRQLQRNSEAIASARKAHTLPHRGFEVVHLVAGMALESEAKPKEAAEEYRTFLSEAPDSPLAPEARRALDSLQQTNQGQQSASLAAAVERELTSAQPMAAVAAPVQAWAPMHVDSAMPPVVNLACPSAEVLERAGVRVQSLVNDLQQFTANEQIEHSEMQGADWRQEQTKSFEYAAEIQRRPSGALAVQEYRNGMTNILSGSVKLLTTGMAAFALIFHPNYVGNFQMKCEGQTRVQGQPAWQVYFAQRPDISSNFRAYWVAGKHYPIKLKGRAWISAETYDVLRLETDLAEPIKDVLQREHIVVNYRSVEFPKNHERLRLPETAEIYMEFRGRRYRDRHSFSNYQLFSVDTTQKTKLPANAEVAED